MRPGGGLDDRDARHPAAAAKGRDLVFAPDPVPADFEHARRRGAGDAAGNIRVGLGRHGGREFDLPEMMQRYPTLTMPLGILYGRGDQILDPALHGERLAAAVPGADLTLMEGGHMIPVTKPDDVAAWIRERSRPRSPA